MGARRDAGRVWCGNLMEGDYLKDPRVDGRIVSNRIFEKWVGGTDCIDLVQDRDR
jgi:hypothetical protein